MGAALSGAGASGAPGASGTLNDAPGGGHGDVGDRPGNVPGIIYARVRHHADTYRQDRALSAEAEAEEDALAS